MERNIDFPINVGESARVFWARHAPGSTTWQSLVARRGSETQRILTFSHKHPMIVNKAITKVMSKERRITYTGECLNKLRWTAVTGTGTVVDLLRELLKLE